MKMKFSFKEQENRSNVHEYADCLLPLLLSSSHIQLSAFLDLD